MSPKQVRERVTWIYFLEGPLQRFHPKFCPKPRQPHFWQLGMRTLKACSPTPAVGTQTSCMHTCKHTHWVPPVTGLRHSVYPVAGTWIPWSSSCLTQTHAHTNKSLQWLIWTYGLSNSSLWDPLVSPVTAPLTTSPISGSQASHSTFWLVQLEFY